MPLFLSLFSLLSSPSADFLNSCLFLSSTFAECALTLPPLLTFLFLSLLCLLSPYLCTSLFLSSLQALSLPPCLVACPWELFCESKLLAWLQQYLKLCHKSCCQTNRLALGQPGSVVFFSFFFLFLLLSWSSLVRGEDRPLSSAAQPVVLELSLAWWWGVWGEQARQDWGSQRVEGLCCGPSDDSGLL